MKKGLLILVGIFATFTTINAQGTLIHYWHFNSYAIGATYTPSIPPIPADYTYLAGSNPQIILTEQPGTSAAFSTDLEGFASLSSDYDTVNLRMSQPAGNYIRVHNPSDSIELLFYTPSTHFKNLVLTFGTSRPANGMTHQDYDYSVDSGATWSTTGLSMLTDSILSTFQRVTLTCSNTTVNNNPRLVFRVRWTGNTTGTSGNNRFDNVTLDGDSISTTSVNDYISAGSEDYHLFPNPVVNSVDINTSIDGMKHIVINNLTGQEQYQCAEEKRQFSINTTNLKAGYYFIRISEIKTGNVSILKFMKM